jgi:threonine synthase
MEYVSTNQKSRPVSFREALLIGQAPDKGLYMPSEIPRVSEQELASMKGLDYADVAFLVAGKFLKGEVPEEDLRRIVRESYDYEVPLERVAGKCYLMRLDRGPTASFKDFAARMMARLMNRFLAAEGRELLILTATSGDTGGAVADAFFGMSNIRVVILMPENEVSERQRRQMTTLGGNITAVLVDGKFDDCQAMVKQAFADQELQRMNLSSANSINFGRLLPQAVYYFYAWSRLSDGGEVIFSVPSGNFGDLMGGLIAKRMGLPVKKFIAAVNENDEFPRFLSTGKYEPVRPSKACLSNAMNVGHPSNLARLIWLYGGLMDEKGVITRAPDLARMRREIVSYSITDVETKNAIKEVYEKHKTILEPHGAVGWAALQRYLGENALDLETVCVSLETAHPAKFPETITELTGVEPEAPAKMREQAGKREESFEINADYAEFKDFLKSRF